MEAAFSREERVTLVGSTTGDLGGVHDALVNHVHILLGVGVVAEANLTAVADLLVDHAAVHAGVLGDLADGGLQSSGDDLCAGLLVAVQGGDQLFHSGHGAMIFAPVFSSPCRVAISSSTAATALT